jgi:hypothetical protein
VASASANGAPYLVPLSFDWDGEALLVATPTDSPTGRNRRAYRCVCAFRVTDRSRTGFLRSRCNKGTHTV